MLKYSPTNIGINNMKKKVLETNYQMRSDNRSQKIHKNL